MLEPTPALPLRLAGCSVAGTACRPARPYGHSPGKKHDRRSSTNSDERSVKRSARSGSGQPVMRSLRRNHGRHYPTSPGREIRETVRSTVDRQQYTENREPAEWRPPPNAVRASPERSDTRAPVNLPQAEPSQRAEASSGRGRRLAPISGSARKDDVPGHPTNERPGRPASAPF